MKNRYIRYVLGFSVLVLTYFGIFLLLFVAGRQLAPGEIVFYSGIAYIFLSLPLILATTYIVNWLLRKCASGWLQETICPFQFEIVFPAIISFLLLSYSFVITIPALLDRSISIFMISVIAQERDEGVGEDAIQDIFLAGYVDGKSVVRKRLNEQLASRNIVMEKGTYKITERGKFVYRVNVFLADLFNIDDKYVRANPKLREN